MPAASGGKRLGAAAEAVSKRGMIRYEGFIVGAAYNAVTLYPARPRLAA